MMNSCVELRGLGIALADESVESYSFRYRASKEYDVSY
jgi:hypothetical protein